MSTSASPPADAWTLTTSGLCSVAANWSQGLPVSGGAVVVAPTSPVTLTFDVANFTLGSLTFQGATLAVQGGILTVTNNTILKAATVLGPHSLVLSGTSQVSGLTLAGTATLNNRGVLTQSGGAVVVGTSKSSPAVIFNSTGANWIDADNSGVMQGAGAGGSFTNNGTFTDSAATGVTNVSTGFTSAGSISVAAGGTLAFSGLFASTGKISVAAHGLVAFTGAGATTQLSGSVNGGGTVEYGPATIATLGALSVTATNQNNLGVVNQIGTLNLNGAQTIDNLGKWNLAGDVSILAGDGANAANTFVGSGVLAKTAGTGVSVVGASVSLSGGVNVATGTLDFTGALNAFSGPISGARTFEIGAGVAQFAPGGLNTELISASHFLLAGGTTQIVGSVTDSGAFEGDAGATLSLGGSGGGLLTLTGAADLAGLKLAGTGDLVLQSTAAVSGLSVGGSAVLFDRGFVTQSGGNVTLDAISTAVPTLTLAYGGVWDIADASGIAAGASSGDAIDVGYAGTAGLFEKTGAGVSVVSPLVLNNSSNLVTNAGVTYQGVEVTSGTLDLHNTVGGTGSDNIVGAGTLEFDGAVLAGQTVSFFGAGGTLELNAPTAFQGAIAGFDTTGSADTLLIAAGSYKYAGATETATAATLAFSDGTHSFSLTLNGDYRSGSFTAQTLANGQIAITH